MQNATLVWRSEDYSRENILVYSNEHYYNASQLINSIFKIGRTCRLTFKDNKYLYQPSNDYKN